MAIFSSLINPTEGTSRFMCTVAFNYLFQALGASVAIPLKTTFFYDLAAASGFISTTIFSLFYPSFKLFAKDAWKRGLTDRATLASFQTDLVRSFGDLSTRQVVMGGMIVIWAVRLGFFLFHRVLTHGEDSRFDAIKSNPRVFAGAWTGQATWVFMSSMPLWIVNTIPNMGSNIPRFGSIFDWAGVITWLTGFGLEVLADHQKSVWRRAKDSKKHDERFITSGLWSWSRHPNYVGEIILWTGPSLLSLSPLLSNLPSHPHSNYSLTNYIPLLAAFTPAIFEYLALKYATGVPPLEQIALDKFGDDRAWSEYREKVPVLFAWPGSKI
ncbi:hypothetical protein FFLO_06290 [Filobasidium floriforme]|uniref:Steroid 5-alpha reductase C-terminal domain-containing protein n=1 Tax=Filobasidium floriforme TaxID=5210 RepID=A0A8K0JHI5_9TREE|nr:uncharacterized protein HD553DRAFT_342398 [Filobasidium floriforme]KAG7528258.1 hypothetical protein FFLO_06290 [Filobasidium floriforme]KAH8084012.1 hypothetical protein HD553DRAFT_342398 [Filobasidium floriforme]